MKVLVIRFSSIGDIVLTTPVVRVLKTQLEDAFPLLVFFTNKHDERG
jgi:ADP-heptose:LPS heptosyltransferase